MKDTGELLALILFVIFVYALCRGVTVNGKHYGIDLDDKKGLVFEASAPVDAGAPEGGL